MLAEIRRFGENEIKPIVAAFGMPNGAVVSSALLIGFVGMYVAH